eukprot:1152021-Pelagomonas_calceolata.AAC.2
MQGSGDAGWLLWTWVLCMNMQRASGGASNTSTRQCLPPRSSRSGSHLHTVQRHSAHRNASAQCGRSSRKAFSRSGERAACAWLDEHSTACGMHAQMKAHAPPSAHPLLCCLSYVASPMLRNVHAQAAGHVRMTTCMHAEG